MNILHTYTLVTDALSKARNIQSQIGQKQLDLKLQNIHQQYQTFGNNRIEAAFARQQILHDIDLLTINRDGYISQAIDESINIITFELANNVDPIFSVGSLALGNIMSFIDAYQIRVSISFPTRVKISQLSNMLILKGAEYFDLKYKVDRFRTF